MAGDGSANSHISLARSWAWARHPTTARGEGPANRLAAQSAGWGPGTFKWRPLLWRSQGTRTQTLLLDEEVEKGEHLLTGDPRQRLGPLIGPVRARAVAGRGAGKAHNPLGPFDPARLDDSEESEDSDDPDDSESVSDDSDDSDDTARPHPIRHSVTFLRLGSPNHSPAH